MKPLRAWLAVASDEDKHREPGKRRPAILVDVYVNVNLSRPPWGVCRAQTRRRPCPPRRRRPASAASGIARSSASISASTTSMSSCCCLQHRAALGQHLQELDELRRARCAWRRTGRAARDLGQRKAEPLAAQDQLDAHPLPLAVDRGCARAARRQQALVFVEADRARGQRELAGEVGNGVGNGIGARTPWRRCRRAVPGTGQDTTKVRRGCRLDRHGDSNDDAASHHDPCAQRVRAVYHRAPAPNRSRDPMNASLPAAVSSVHHALPDAARARARRARSRPGMLWLRMPLPFALDHINLWLLADGGRLDRRSIAATATRATRALWESHFATTLAGSAAHARHRDALPSRSPRQRRVAGGSASTARWR